MEKLNVKAMAGAIGITWGAGMLLLGWASIFGWGTKVVDVMSSVYIGFAPSFLGGIIGAIWGLVDGAIGGAIIALVYNVFVRKKQ
ncbi:MAG: bacteriophage holin [Candidatus Brocadiales bacterium]